MTQQTWQDYGGPESRMLVPSTLRGYRLFTLHNPSPPDWTLRSTDWTLRSISYSHEWQIGEWNLAKCDKLCVKEYRSVESTEDNFCQQCCDDWLRATIFAGLYEQYVGTDRWLTQTVFCDCKYTERMGGMPARFSLAWWIEPGPDELKWFNIDTRIDYAHPREPAPDISCSCGFYAAYTPGHLRGAPGAAFILDGPTIFGAVEARGRTILGPRGFRAQEMRVVALAPGYTTSDYPEPADKVYDALLDMAKGADIPVYRTRARLQKDFPPVPVEELLK